MKDACRRFCAQARQVFGAAGELHTILCTQCAKQIARGRALRQFKQQLGQIGLVDAGMHQRRMRLKPRLCTQHGQRRNAGVNAVMRGRYIQQHDSQR